MDLYEVMHSGLCTAVDHGHERRLLTEIGKESRKECGVLIERGNTRRQTAGLAAYVNDRVRLPSFVCIIATI